MKNANLTSSNVCTTAPKWLGKYGKYLWPKLAAYLNANSKIIKADQYLLQQYCSAYDMFRRSYDELNEEGIQVPIYEVKLNPKDGKPVSRELTGYRKNPAYKMMFDAINTLNRLGRELGMSPKARSEMIGFKDVKSDDKPAVEKMKEFFG